MNLYDAINLAIQNCETFEFRTLELEHNDDREFKKFIAIRLRFKSIFSATDTLQTFDMIGRHCQASTSAEIGITAVVYGENTVEEFEKFSKLRDAFYEKYPEKAVG